LKAVVKANLDLPIVWVGLNRLPSTGMGNPTQTAQQAGETPATPMEADPAARLARQRRRLERAQHSQNSSVRCCSNATRRRHDSFDAKHVVIRTCGDAQERLLPNGITLS